MSRLNPPPSARGFTLAEALMAAAVLAIAVAAITQAVVAGQMQTYEALRQYRAASLAEALLEEILALPYEDPDGASSAGPDAGESSRASFDNCDDYHGFTELPGQLADGAGELYPPPFQEFRRSVTAVYGPTALGDLGVLPGLTVTVTVTDAGGLIWTTTRFIPEPAER